MKKIVLMIMAMCMLMSPTCLASNWYWVSSSDKSTTYVDTASGRWQGKILRVTTKDVKTDGSYNIEDIGMTLKNRRFIWHIYDFWAYDSDGTFLAEQSGSPDATITMPPDSRGEHNSYIIMSLFIGQLKSGK